MLKRSINLAFVVILLSIFVMTVADIRRAFKMGASL